MSQARKQLKDKWIRISVITLAEIRCSAAFIYLVELEAVWTQLDVLLSTMCILKTGFQEPWLVKAFKMTRRPEKTRFCSCRMSAWSIHRIIYNIEFELEQDQSMHSFIRSQTKSLRHKICSLNWLSFCSSVVSTSSPLRCFDVRCVFKIYRLLFPSLLDLCQTGQPVVRPTFLLSRAAVK